MLVVGLISGTSADGVDAALCELSGAPPQFAVRLVRSLTNPYAPVLRERVLAAFNPQTSRVDALCQLNFDLGEAFADAALAVIAAAGINPADVDLIGSHGQTVWHMVQPNGRATATLQLGEPALIAERTGITTVSGFRARDIAAGGQGAPLASYLDWALLRHPNRWRAAQNIGGIGNVTFLPPLSDSHSAPLAFDTGPGNALLDSAISLLTDGAQTYDRDGALAAAGQVNAPWLDQLLTNPYYAMQPPKSTGRELFSAAMAAELVAEGRARGLTPADVLATLTALTAATIADAYARFAPAPIAEVVVSGGGRSNPVLMARLRECLPNTAVLTLEELGLSGDHKEALVFALLAYETWHNRPSAHPALTGARHASVLGHITPGNNYAALLRRTWCV
ncbi:MAG: anhydro-N-acetylmuramic acid kinase [Aggregatilineales bacterium]